MAHRRYAPTANRLAPERALYARGVAAQQIPCFSLTFVEKAAKVLGDAMTGTELGIVLAASTIEDVDGPGPTKWKRIANALQHRQHRDGLGNCVVRFITEAMSPVRFHDDRAGFIQLQSDLNEILVFEGLRVNDEGRVAKVPLGAARTHDEAAQRSSFVHAELARRDAHPEALRYCTAEIFAKDNFHAVFEATKSIAARLREMTGQTGDGASLVDSTLLPKDNPRIAINRLADETDQSEQSGFASIAKGIMGLYRNPPAHRPRQEREVTDAELLEAFAVISMIHRRLDTAEVRPNS